MQQRWKMTSEERAVCRAGEGNRAAYLRRRTERPRLAEMTEDFGLLAAELERCFGGTGTMPTRAQLRAITRTDLEKAMVAHGGPAAVAKRMGWKLAYKVLMPLNGVVVGINVSCENVFPDILCGIIDR